MAQEIIQRGNSLFEQIKQIDENGNEFWYARQLAKVLEYADFSRNFVGVINKAKEACTNSGQEETDHVVEANEMVVIGSGAERDMPSFKMSRYFCYLIVQNADPSKEVVALGQTYFAVQTRLQEIEGLSAYQKLNTEEEKRLFLRNEMAKHNTQLAAAAKNAGVIDPKDYAIFQNHGYKGLYGGLDAKGIHQKKGLQKNQQILDHMGSTELAANLFRATQAEEKLRRETIKGKQKPNKPIMKLAKKCVKQ
jgi:DNA-damage-inducible protein D